MTEPPAGPAGEVSGGMPVEIDIAELAGGLRTAVNRLAHGLRGPATRHGITPSRLTALATLERHGPMRPGDLASRMSITAASMSRLAEVLEEGGWIAREDDPTDRRACLLSVSEQGRTTLSELRRENASDLARDITAMTDDQRAALSAALPVLVVLADHRLDSAPGR